MSSKFEAIHIMCIGFVLFLFSEGIQARQDQPAQVSCQQGVPLVLPRATPANPRAARDV